MGAFVDKKGHPVEIRKPYVKTSLATCDKVAQDAAYQTDFSVKSICYNDRHYSCAACFSAAAVGILTVKVAPFLGTLSTSIVPPCSWTIWWVMASPSPAP